MGNQVILNGKGCQWSHAVVLYLQSIYMPMTMIMTVTMSCHAMPCHDHVHVDVHAQAKPAPHVRARIRPRPPDQGKAVSQLDIKPRVLTESN